MTVWAVILGILSVAFIIAGLITAVLTVAAALCSLRGLRHSRRETERRPS